MKELKVPWYLSQKWGSSDNFSVLAIIISIYFLYLIDYIK